MKLKVLGSSSEGNGYILESDSEALCIEAGVKLSEFKKALDFNIKKIKGVIVSHTHGDHSKYIKDFASAGIRIYANKDTIDNHGLSVNIFSFEVEEGKAYRIGGFVVQPLKMYHDVPCFGYIIKHHECGKILFATDTNEIPYIVKDVNYFIVETNYSSSIISENIELGIVDERFVYRLVESHMEINDTINFLKQQELSNTKRIILIHMSSKNSDSKQFVELIEKSIGIPATAALPGVEINISNNPY